MKYLSLSNGVSVPLYAYCRRAAIYYTPTPRDRQHEQDLADFDTFEDELRYMDIWKYHNDGAIVAMITLHYVSREQLTPEEMDGRETEDIPACLLVQATVEYKTIAPRGDAGIFVKLEELHMRCFGGSRDDGFKYGALAGLADPVAAYAMDIYSVRGKRYRFDLCSNAAVSSSTYDDTNDDINNNNNKSNPTTTTTTTTTNTASAANVVVKPLCVTIDHRMDEVVEEHDDDDEEEEEIVHPIVKMEFTMCGKPRHYSKTNQGWMDNLPSFHHIPNGLADTFLRLSPRPPAMVTSSPSGHTLILDPTFAGRIYVNGRYCTTWGNDVRSASHGIALFGMDLHSTGLHDAVSIPVDTFGTIQDFEAVKQLYAQLWQEILIDARLLELRLARRLLFRLLKGVDPPDDDDDGYDAEGYDDFPDDDEATTTSSMEDCFESLVLSAPTYDRVGIAPKALATRFAEEFGRPAFPCQVHEVEWVRQTLPDRDPIVVPLRLISILRRGGYFDIQKTADLLWFTNPRPLSNGAETTIAEIAVQHLEAAGCRDVDGDNIVVFSSPVASNVVTKDAVCRWNASSEQFFVHEAFFFATDARVYRQCQSGRSTRN